MQSNICVRWTITVDDKKCQKFCLAYKNCPGWKIKPIGLQKVYQASSSDYWHAIQYVAMCYG